MARDMTYIDDVVNGITKSINFICDCKKTSMHEIFNFGNDSPILTSYLLQSVEKNLQKKSKNKT